MGKGKRKKASMGKSNKINRILSGQTGGSGRQEKDFFPRKHKKSTK